MANDRRRQIIRAFFRMRKKPLIMCVLHPEPGANKKFSEAFLVTKEELKILKEQYDEWRLEVLF